MKCIIALLGIDQTSDFQVDKRSSFKDVVVGWSQVSGLRSIDGASELSFIIATVESSSLEVV